ncbi:major facilitator superfamily domain-containing protein 9-like [Onthophagus taurus]|uniref:major facilitator superfamily domain-containing protein 9-like n=1 Tax=Onthophagus taurus TaxID=166361 RepID=UPI0039BEAE8D
MKPNKYNLFIVYGISFMDLFAIGLMFPLLQPHLRSLGASHLTIGLMGSTYSALQVLAGPLIGSWSDLRGRKQVLILTLIICMVCYFLIGLSSWVFLIFIFRFILGGFKHTQTLCKALIVDLLPKTEHAQAYGRSSGLGMLGFVIGPILGGHVSELNDGFMYVCWITSGLFLINITLTCFLPSTKGSFKSEKVVNLFDLIKGINLEMKKSVEILKKINWKIYWDAFLIRFLFGITTSFFHSNQSLYLKEKHNLSQLYIGYTISFFSIIGVLTSLTLGWITETFYKNDTNCLQRLFHSFVILSISCLGFYLAPNLIVFYTFLIPFGITTALVRIVSMEMMLTKSGKEEKGSLSGASNSIMSISRFFTPLMSGVVGDFFGEESVMFFAFVPAIIGSIVCYKLLSKVKFE